MGKKKDFWELADSTILGRTKKTELLQIARKEHGQVEAYRAQLDVQAERLKAQGELVEQLRIQLSKGEPHKDKIETLMQALDEQQHHHEQELRRLQSEARDWEKVAQDYKATVVKQKSIINSYEPIVEKVKSLAQMDVKDAVAELVNWLFIHHAERTNRARR